MSASSPKFEAAATEADGRSEAAKPPASSGADGMNRMNLDGEFPVMVQVELSAVTSP